MRGDGFKLTELRSVGKAQVKYMVLGGTCVTPATLSNLRQPLK